MEEGGQKLRVRLVGRNGRRRYDPTSKDRLIAACLEPGVSVSRLALEHGVNANLLWKWIRQHRLVQQGTVALDPFAAAVFAFCNRRRDRMKLLFFDRSGCVLVLKRLTEDKFRWPRREAAVVTLTTEQLHWILDGIDIDAVVRHPVRHYQVAG